MKRLLSIVLVLCLVFTLCACGKKAPQAPSQAESAVSEPVSPPEVSEDYGTVPANISIGTTPTGQAAYTMGAGIADLINKSGIGTNCTAEETNGIAVNVGLLMNGDIEIAFTTNMIAEQANAATGSYESLEPGRIKTIMSVSPIEMQIIVPKDSDIESVYDLAGKRVGMGQPGGSSLEVANIFAEACGYAPDDFEHIEVNLATQCDYLRDGQLDVIIWNGSAPMAAVTALGAEKELRMLDIPDEVISKMQNTLSAFESYTMSKDKYDFLENDVKTFSLRMILTTRDDISNECIYQFTKIIMENTEELGQIHPSLGKINKDTALLGITPATPLHEGAARYYGEIGMDVSTLQ